MKDILLAVVVGGAFAILFLPLYVESDFFFPFITGKNFAFRILVEIITAAWVLLALLDTQYRPRFSWLLPTFASLLGVMFLANLLGEYPLKSFMSNYERMDGFVTLVHVFLFTFVLASILKTRALWSGFVHVSLGVATVVALYGLGQQTGVIEGGGGRIDSRLGNAAYMAVYMLFHIFALYFLLLQKHTRARQVTYALLLGLFVYVMLQTGTRGTFIGLTAGSLVSALYIALFAKRDKALRKLAIALVAVVVVGAGSLFVLKDTAFIASTPLERIANINLQEDLEVRMTIWGIAAKGVMDRPLLGWGQGNFNYVFNQYYDPFLYDQEQWFDRVHNLPLDWLIAGGVLGMLAYFSVMAAFLYYVVVVPQVLRRPSPLSVPEQAVLLGLLTAYVLHNFVVFDNIISYIFYGVTLAYVHHIVARPSPTVQQVTVSEKEVTQVALPLVLLGTMATIYFVNMPGIQASRDIIDALVAPTTTRQQTEFESALARDSFAEQEVVEQYARHAMEAVNDTAVTADAKQTYVLGAEAALQALIEKKPDDARLHNFATSFYRAVGAFPQAREQAAKAVALSPLKPSLLVEQAVVELQAGEPEAALDILEDAYALAPSNPIATALYIATLVRTSATAEAAALFASQSEAKLEDIATNDYLLSSLLQTELQAEAIRLLETRIQLDPNDLQSRVSVAYLYYEQGASQEAITLLEETAALFPEAAPFSSCVVDSIETGGDPREDCQE